MVLVFLLACLPSAKQDSQTTSSSSSTDSTGTTDSTGITDSTPTDSEETVSVSGLSVSASLTTVNTRDPLTLTATAEMSDGSTKDVTADATWSSSDPKVIRVTPDGMATSLSVGSATLEASYEGNSDDVTVEVKEVVTPQAGEVVINELLADAVGDPNGDGTADPVDDEFVELANHAGIAMDLSGMTLTETGQPDKPRHTFPEGTMLMPGEVLVVFGGGTPTGFQQKHCAATAAVNADSGLKLGLALNNDGDTLTLHAVDGSSVAELTYGDRIPAVDGASLVLDPEITGSRYLDHRSASPTGLTWSPCTRVDQTDF